MSRGLGSLFTGFRHCQQAAREVLDIVCSATAWQAGCSTSGRSAVGAVAMDRHGALQRAGGHTAAWQFVAQGASCTPGSSAAWAGQAAGLGRGLASSSSSAQAVRKHMQAQICRGFASQPEGKRRATAAELGMYGVSYPLHELLRC